MFWIFILSKFGTKKEKSTKANNTEAAAEQEMALMGNSGNGEVATASVSTCLGEAEIHLNLPKKYDHNYSSNFTFFKPSPHMNADVKLINDV